MTPNDWERLKPLFEQASELPSLERAGFVRDICLKDRELGRMLQELLEATEGAGPIDSPFLDLHEVFPMDPPAGNSRGFSETQEVDGLSTGHAVAGRFRLVRHVGKGGMGDVYEAEDIHLKEHVALKTIRADIAANPLAVARFKREILLGKKVTHPNVCRIHDLGVTQPEGRPAMFFLTMEFLEGETLSSRIKRGRMRAEEALPLILDMADGLAAAHDAHVVHRDFKSGNVMLVRAPDRIKAIITDFGLARALQADTEGTELTKPGAVAGTAGYMSPEQIRGEEVTPASDIYSLGVVAFEMVTGRRPFSGDSDVAIALHHLNDDPPSPRQFTPELDVKWETAILGCLRKSPAERFQCAEKFKAALLGRPSESIPLRPRRSPRFAILSLAGALIMIAGGYGAWNYRQKVVSLVPREQRVAVLEFENIGGDPANQALCQGLMETLSSQLTELEQFQGSLAVVPTSDIRRDNVTSAREAKRDFGVSLVITGSVQRSPGGTRLTVNVVDAVELKQLRSHGMFIPDADAEAMQQGVITEVSQLLDIPLRPQAKRQLAAGDTAVPGVYEAYLRGSGYLASGRVGLDQAIAEFRGALERDPDYALAHAGLGQAYWNKYSATRDRDWIDQAWRECRRAIELAPQLADPHVTLAILNSGTGHYEDAIEEARQAIKIDPRNDRAYAEMARAMDGTGKTAAAETTLKKAIELKPDYWYNHVRLGIFYGQHGKYKEAEAPFQRAIQLVPDNPTGYTDLAAIYHLEGRESEAEQMLKKSIEARPTTLAYSNLATVYFFERRYADAVPIMEKLVADGTKDYLLWGNLGDAYRWTPGNTEKALKAYQQAITLAAEAVAVNPRDAAALSSMAVYEAKSGLTARALQAMEKAVAAAPDNKGVLFKATVVYELAGERARALKYLRRAIVGGYSPSEIATEPDLGKLRQDPGYQAAVSPNNEH